MGERAPLASKEIFPTRLDSPAVQTAEKLVAAAICVLAIATAVVCIVFGMKYHTDHILMGIVVVLSASQFLWIGRFYLQDIIQDRKIVYYSAVVTIFVCATGLMYATAWQAAKGPPATGCPDNSFYNPSSKACVAIPDTFFNNNTVGQFCLWEQFTDSFVPLYNETYLNFTCSDAANAVMNCYGMQSNPLQWMSDCPS